MKKGSQKRWQFARSGLGFLLVLILVLVLFSGSNALAQTDEAFMSDYVKGEVTNTFTGDISMSNKKYEEVLPLGYIWHEVIFNPNGGLWGEGDDEPMRIMFLHGHVLYAWVIEEPIRTGYIFKGWHALQGLTTITDSEKWIVESSKVFHALWEYGTPPDIHEITFNLNDGQVPSLGYGPIVYNFPHGQVLWDNIFAINRDGYALMGWCLVGDGTSLVSLSGWIVEGPQTFYAIWVPGHEIIFNTNGGLWWYGHDVSRVYMFPHGQYLSWNAHPLMRTDYIFMGWCLVGDGTLPVSLSEWIIEGPQTFFAMWERDGNSACENTNLALGATMTASSAQGVRTADRANNGIRSGAATDSWSATGIGQEWLMVDFGEQLNFNHIKIYQGGNRIANYRFEYSNDGVNWTIFHFGNRIMEATPVYYEFATSTRIQAQFVRLLSENSFGVLPIVVFEFEIYYMP